MKIELITKNILLFKLIKLCEESNSNEFRNHDDIERHIYDLVALYKKQNLSKKAIQQKFFSEEYYRYFLKEIFNIKDKIIVDDLLQVIKTDGYDTDRFLKREKDIKLNGEKGNLTKFFKRFSDFKVDYYCLKLGFDNYQVAKECKFNLVENPSNKTNSISEELIKIVEASQNTLEDKIKNTQNSIDRLKEFIKKNNSENTSDVKNEIGLLTQKITKLKSESDENFIILERNQKDLGKDFFTKQEKIEIELQKITLSHADLTTEINIKIEKIKSEILEKQNLGFNEVVQSISSLKNSVEDIHEKITISESRKDQISKVYVEGGTFTMGKKSWWDYEYKPHKVEIDSFYISQYPVTNKEFADFLNEVKNIDEEPFFVKIILNLSITLLNDRYYAKKDKENYPAIGITWYGATAYSKWVRGRLPTEAEWEFAARGGNKSRGYKYSGSNKTKHIANCSSIWKKITQQDTELLEIGSKLPNELEIYGMSGNVWEWCADWHDVFYYETLQENQKITKNPLGAETGTKKIIRGGDYLSNKFQCTVYHRDRYKPEHPFFTNRAIGFRVVFDV